MHDFCFERVAELRILAQIARVNDRAGLAFQRHVKLVHEDIGTELSAVARTLIRSLPPHATPRQVAAIFDHRADEIEASWSDAH